jgi:hypothetical protein
MLVCPFYYFITRCIWPPAGLPGPVGGVKVTCDNKAGRRGTLFNKGFSSNILRSSLVNINNYITTDLHPAYASVLQS